MQGMARRSPGSFLRVRVALLLATTAAVFLHLVPGAPALPALDPGALARRTPPPGDWSARPVDADHYFSPEEQASFRAYRQRHRQVNLVALGADLVLYLLLLGAPGRRLRRWCDRVGLRPPRGSRPPGRMGRLAARVLGETWPGAIIFACLYFALGLAVDLPTSLWHEQIAQQAGRSAYTACTWLWDFGKSLVVSCVLYSMLVLGLFGLIRRFPRRWWMVLALPAAGAYAGYAALSPYQVRLLHEVVPLQASPLAAGKDDLIGRLTWLAQRKGITIEQIKVVNSSRVGRTLNAYLSGLGRSRELVLHDTLLAEATPAEIEVVVAHELGHLTGEGPLRTWALGSAALACLLWLLSSVLRRGAGWLGLPGPGDVGTLPLLGLTVSLVFVLTTPAANALARQREMQADREALVLTGEPEAFISLQVKLARRNMQEVDPSRWVRFWLFAHPSVIERIGTALWYRRWLQRAPGSSRGGPHGSWWTFPARAAIRSSAGCTGR